MPGHIAELVPAALAKRTMLLSSTYAKRRLDVAQALVKCVEQETYVPIVNLLAGAIFEHGSGLVMRMRGA
jgi:hypothetical protein